MKTYHDVSTTAVLPEDRAAGSEPLASDRRGFGFAWIDSVWITLAISFIVGLLYTLVLLGPVPLNPHNISWLKEDSAMYYTGWELFRQDPHWHWPLTYTNRVGYPVGEDIALMDPTPLLV